MTTSESRVNYDTPTTSKDFIESESRVHSLTNKDRMQRKKVFIAARKRFGERLKRS